MDPVTLIVTALTAGASIVLKDAASIAAQDAYESLKALVRKRIANRRDGQVVLAGYEREPETWERPLVAELIAAKADRDADLVAAAQAVMRLADAAGSRAGKYTVDMRGAQAVQVGDGNTQHNTFYGS